MAGVMEVEEVSPDCEGHAIMIVTARLSKRILQQGRAHLMFTALLKKLLKKGMLI